MSPLDDVGVFAMGTILIIAALGTGLAALFILPWLWRKGEERRLAALCRARRAIILSYDDGPGSVLTPKLLSLLHDRSAKANFFMLGRHAAGNEAVVRQVIAAGHEVGSHSFAHSNAWKRDPFTVARDFDHGRTTMATLGAENIFFRPPYGKLTLIQWIVEARRGTRFAWWSVDSKDSWARRPIADVTAEITTKGGGVVLMHDFDDYSSGGHAISHVDHVLALTTAILDLAQANDMRVMTMGELYGAKSAA